MNIISINPKNDFILEITFENNLKRYFDLKYLLTCEAFEELKDYSLFKRVKNCGYFIEWENGADLSADTLFLKSTENIGMGKG